MKIQELHDMWEEDGEFGPDYTRETNRIPKLHNKYWKLYISEAIKSKSIRDKYYERKKFKKDYYSGKFDAAEIEEYGLEPLDRKVFKEQIPEYLQTDKELVTLTQKIEIQKLKVEFLESILTQIKNRNFLIKNMIEFEKFKTGA